MMPSGPSRSVADEPEVMKAAVASGTGGGPRKADTRKSSGGTRHPCALRRREVAHGALVGSYPALRNIGEVVC
jgi:hypothetical protein